MATNDPPDQERSKRIRRRPRPANSSDAKPGSRIRRSGQMRSPQGDDANKEATGASPRPNPLRQSSGGSSVRRSGRHRAVSDANRPNRRSRRVSQDAAPESTPAQSTKDSAKSGVRRRANRTGQFASPRAEGAPAGSTIRRTGQMRSPLRSKGDKAPGRRTPSQSDASGRSSSSHSSLSSSSHRRPRSGEEQVLDLHSEEAPSDDQVLAVIKPQRKVAIRRKDKPTSPSQSAFEEADDFFNEDASSADGDALGDYAGGDELGNYSDAFDDDPIELDDDLDDSFAAPPAPAPRAREARPRGASAPHRQSDNTAQLSSQDAARLEEMVEQRLAAMEAKLRKELKKQSSTAPAASTPAAAHGGEHGEVVDEEERDLLPMDWGLAGSVSQAAASERQQKNRLDFFLSLMIDRGASDFHFHVGNSPTFRQGGEMIPMRYRPIRQRDWARFVRPICPEGMWEQWETTGDVDFAYEIAGLSRFRVNLFRQHGGGSAVFRVIPTKILTLEELGMPPQLNRFAELSSGLVLITGPTGSGKSTTLAAIIDMINTRKHFHIITIEDPIEFVHKGRSCIIHQREIGTHASTFDGALVGAVREDPDLILVGEMRDQQTVRLALEAAEKGVLVFGTLHTNSATKTIDRIVNVFPITEQDQIRSVLADTIEGVVSQQLLRRTKGGRVAALEIMFSTSAMGNIIREGKTAQLSSLIQTGVRMGMVTMDDSLLRLIREEVITVEAALEKAIEKDRFKPLLEGNEDP